MKVSDMTSEILPRLGHRNWIAIVDAAYPEQVREGITMLVVPGPAIGIVGEVLAEIARTHHVRADVFVDTELDFLDEADSPGATEYRAALRTLLAPLAVNRLPHEEIIGMLGEAARRFRVLILKTELTLPYTSIFLRLECGYWSLEAQSRLQARIDSTLPRD